MMTLQQLRTTFRWASLRDKLSTSLWLTPFAYTLVAGGLAATLVWVDHQRSIKIVAWLTYRGSAEGAREVLGTIASSMLTISGVVFSITILVLQLASSQFSPRVLRTFLQDSVTQRTMGTLLGSFMYSMMVLPTVRSEDDAGHSFIPGLAVVGSLVSVLVSIGFFIQYIHHMAHSIRAVSVIARVAEETHRSIARLYPDQAAGVTPDARPLPEAPPNKIIRNRGEAGVLISVEKEALMTAARRADLIIAVLPSPGDFVPRNAPLCHVWGSFDDSGSEIEEALVLARERTPYQDAMFGFRQLVDIAERALSPGVNDPTTASQVLDQLHDLLRTLVTRAFPSPQLADDDGNVRLVLPRPDFPEYVRLSFEEIRTYGTSSVQVVRKMRSVLEDLRSVAPCQRASCFERELSLLDAAAARALPGLTH